MSTKRKAILAAANASADGTETPPSKRRKLPNPEDETPETTTKTGYDLLAQLKKSRDKQGWHIATHFMTLPSRDDLPEYYEQIGLPMALDTIEGKLEKQSYPTITALESDVKRMVSNAKSYNAKTSQIYSDAEKVRKLVSNFMVERNPAYRDPTYQAVATPVPADWEPKPIKNGVSRAGPVSEAIKLEETASETRSGRRLGRTADQTPVAEEDNRRTSSTPVFQDAEGAGESFEGNSFQQAQDKIVTEMMSLTDENNQLVSINFINLPSRTLVDYYKVIKHPVSLKGLQKLVRGIKGHAPPSGSTLLKSWKAFDEEASFIWNNAREYNEDSSEIVRLASILQEYFHRRLKEAKAAVSDPPQPRVKLTIGGKSPEPQPKITLKFGNPKPSSSAGVTVDSEALKRQQEVVRAGINGQMPTQATPGRLPSEKSGSGSENGIVMNGIKRETSHSYPSVSSGGQANGISQPTMAPPLHLTSRIPSGSPHPQSLGVNGSTSSSSYISSTFNSFMRPSGKDAFDALIVNLNISDHPDSNVLPRFNLEIPALDSRTHQSVTITLPNGHSYIRIAPTLSSSLMQRPSKTFVTCNNRRQQALAQRDLDQIRPLYEHMLSPGVNTIEVEVIAGLPRGAPKSGSGSDIEIEKITLFAHLQRP